MELTQLSMSAILDPARVPEGSVTAAEEEEVEEGV